MRNIIPSAAARSRSMMMAVVLGTAFAAGQGRAATQGVKQTATARPDATSDIVYDITRYCQVCWRNARLPADRWDDCTQQVFTRLLERVPPTVWHTLLKEDSTERREFLRAIDTVKKRTQRARRYADLSMDVNDERNRAGEYLREQREAVDRAAEEVLSPRQQRIVEMTADGWAVPEIAAELCTTTERISDEKYKAIRKLRTHFGIDD